jgi:hypothetical protein
VEEKNLWIIDGQEFKFVAKEVIDDIFLFLEWVRTRIDSLFFKPFSIKSKIDEIWKDLDKLAEINNEISPGEIATTEFLAVYKLLRTR